MPANWVPCAPVIIAPPKTFAELEERNKQIQKNRNGMAWYLSFKKPEHCIADNEKRQLEAKTQESVPKIQ